RDGLGDRGTVQALNERGADIAIKQRPAREVDGLPAVLTECEAEMLIAERQCSACSDDRRRVLRQPIRLEAADRPDNVQCKRGEVERSQRVKVLVRADR